MSLWVRVVMLVNINVGLWFSVFYVYLFNIFRHGNTVGEPIKTLAYMEFFMAIICISWFIWCTVWVLSKSHKVEG